MTHIHFTALLSLHPTLPQESTILTTLEHGTEVKTEVTYNKKTEVLTIITPAHNDLIASVNMFHEPSNTRVEMVNDVCYLSEVPKNFESNHMIKMTKEMESVGNRITESLASPVFLDKVDEDIFASEERCDGLPEDMKMLCAGKAIKEVIYVERLQRDSDILTLTNQTSQRKKRFVSGCSWFCDTSDVCLGRDQKSCTWYFCSRSNPEIYERGEICAIMHVASGLYDCAPCCKDEVNEALCKCSELVQQGRPGIQTCKSKLRNFDNRCSNLNIRVVG